MTAERERILQKIRRVQALAERGVAGEQESAAATLDRLMKQYGITEAELEEERREMAWFRYTTPIERKLLSQVIYSVTGRAAYDLNRDNPEAKRAAQRRRGPLAAARWALRVAGWAENVLAVLMIAWLGFLLGAILTGTFFVFGYPV